MYTMPVTCRPTCLHDILTNCYWSWCTDNGQNIPPTQGLVS
jgi:hypothetical protein